MTKEGIKALTAGGVEPRDDNVIVAAPSSFSTEEVESCSGENESEKARVWCYRPIFSGSASLVHNEEPGDNEPDAPLPSL